MDTSLTWRQVFPWTDEQIIKICLEEAARMVSRARGDGKVYVWHVFEGA